VRPFGVSHFWGSVHNTKPEVFVFYSCPSGAPGEAWLI
jgi:hypothetical protein